jgi:hypothetical protein
MLRHTRGARMDREAATRPAQQPGRTGLVCSRLVTYETSGLLPLVTGVLISQTSAVTSSPDYVPTAPPR